MKNISQSMSDYLQALWSRMMARRSGLRGDSGQAIVELALGLPILILLLLGIGETGILVYDSIEVSNAAHAGALYGMRSGPFASDTPGIITAAQAEATDLGVTLTVTPTTYFLCSAALNGTQYSTQTAVNAACPDGPPIPPNHSLQFVRVNTSAAVTPPIKIPFTPATITLTGSSVMEVQE